MTILVALVRPGLQGHPLSRCPRARPAPRTYPAATDQHNEEL